MPTVLRQKLLGLSTLASTLAIAGLCYAADPAPVIVKLPDEFILGKAPSGGSMSPPATPQTTSTTSSTSPALQTRITNGVETAQDTPGLPRQYTVVTPIFLGDDHGTTSYIRFFNGQNATAETDILVVGNHTGHVYGTANVIQPIYSSPQFIISDLLNAANVHGFIDGDDGYSLYLEDPGNTGNNGFQHMIYSINSGFFENASMCTYFNNEQYSAINQILINVHTSILPDFPAYIYIHNVYPQPVTYSVTITESMTGQVLGQITLQTLNPNTSYRVPETFFEQAIGWHPQPNQYQVNLFFHGDPGYYAIVGQMIYNAHVGSYVNVTHFCAINHWDASVFGQ